MKKKVPKKHFEAINYVSHELRAPVSIAKSAIALVIDDVVKGKNAKAVLQRANASLDRIVSIISQNLDMTRIEKGEKKWKYECVDVFKKVQTLIKDFQNRAKNLSIKLIDDVPKTVSPIYVDEGAFEQVLINLIDNALKFTPKKGEVRISAKNLKDSFVEVSISDTGCGISKDDIKNIFKKYFSANNQLGEAKGIGLGLSIVKRLVSVNKGKIWVESEPDKGTTFRFICPEYQLKKEELKEPKTKLKKRTPNILIVDDEEMICELVFQFLTDKKFEVTVCHSGKEAIQHMKEKRFDIVFCDMVMPHMNGVATVKALRKIDPVAKIIIITGYAVEDDLCKAQKEGAYVGLPKPFEMDDVYLVVKKSMELDNKAFKNWLQEARIGLFGNRQMDKAA